MGVMKMTSVKLRRKIMVSLSRLHVHESVRFECVLGESRIRAGNTVVWQPSGAGRFGWLFQNHYAGRFSDLSVKIGGTFGAAG